MIEKVQAQSPTGGINIQIPTIVIQNNQPTSAPTIITTTPAPTRETQTTTEVATQTVSPTPASIRLTPDNSTLYLAIIVVLLAIVASAFWFGRRR